MNLSTDVVVIGDGIIGSATALELLKQGIDVILVGGTHRSNVEKASAAAGAMLGALGEITVDDKDERAQTELTYRLKSAKAYSSFVEEITNSTGCNIKVTQGTVIVGNNEGSLDYDNLNAIIATAHSVNEKAEWIDWKSVVGLRPARKTRPVGCVWLPNEAGIDSSDLLKALGHALSKKTTTVINEVSSVERQASLWKISLKDGSIISCNKVVVAAGARTEQVLGTERWKKLNLPRMFFGKGASCVVQPSTATCPHVIRTPNRAFACGVHMVPRSDDNVYIGATNFFGESLDDEAGIEVGEMHILFEQAIHQIDVNIRRAKIKESRYGFRPIVTSREPIVGETEDSGLYVGTGTYRNGVLMAPLIATQIAYEIVNGVPMEDNPYSPQTFKQRQKDADVGFVVETGLRDIAEILQEPGGHLPYNRSDELAALLQNLWILAFEDSPQLGSFRLKVKQRLNDVPLTETMNRLLYELLEVDSAAQERDEKQNE